MDTLAVIAALSVWGLGGYAIGYLDGQRAELKRQLLERNQELTELAAHPETTRRRWLERWRRKLS